MCVTDQSEYVDGDAKYEDGCVHVCASTHVCVCAYMYVYVLCACIYVRSYAQVCVYMF